jgi:hypothetical protein
MSAYTTKILKLGLILKKKC